MVGGGGGGVGQYFQEIATLGVVATFLRGGGSLLSGFTSSPKKMALISGDCYFRYYQNFPVATNQCCFFLSHCVT